LLKLDGLHAGYGRVPVVADASLEVVPGEMVALFGANGAGKTTLLKAIAGFVKPSAGVITLSGRPLPAGKPERTAARGIRMVLEGHRVFPELTVEQNLKLARYTMKRGAAFDERQEQALSLFPALKQKLAQYASDLSGGQQQLLAMAQAVIGEPEYLLCDEPSLGVASILIPEILRALRALADDGCGVLVVEQAVEPTLSYVDRVLVMDRGLIVLEGAATAYRDQPSSLKDVILGSTAPISANDRRDIHGISRQI